MSTRRSAVLAAILTVLLTLTACADIPTSSGVGLTEVSEDRSDALTQIDPDGPVTGADPSEIVRGFLAAGTGTTNNFEVAREFLTGDAAEDWNPMTGVTVMPSGSDLGDIGTEITSNQQEVSLEVPVQGSVDDQGIYRSAQRDLTSRLEFKLRQENGEWRISSAPDGIVLTVGNFQSIFQSYAVFFFDPSLSYLVPEDRWIVRRASVATDLVQRLIDGPPEWLSGAVVTAVPEGLRLGGSAVTIQEGVATVSLDDSALALNERSRALLRAQLEATLEQISTVSSVEIEVDGEDFGGLQQVSVERSVQIRLQPVVISDGGLARLDGTSVTEVEGSPSVEEGAAPAVGLDEDFYAFLADEGRSLHRFAEGEESEIASGTGLIPPSIDRMNVVWTGERENSGELLAVLPEGGTTTISTPFLQGREVSRARVSRDGSRLLVVSSDGDGDYLSLVGINRDSSGLPVGTSSSSPLELGEGYQRIEDAAWGSLGRIVVLGSENGGTTQGVWSGRTGGPLEDLGAVEGAQTVTAAEDNRSIRVGTVDGTIISHVGGSWQRVIDLTAWEPAYPG